MTNCCAVVIGHVDHGKTALVRALTGIDTDRLAEERARGLSIVAGYAHHGYPDGTLDFVDAPGHEDFVQAMIRGAAGARAALVVVSAVEGVRAQTREHLAIAGLLGIDRVLVAVTKSDLLAPEEIPSRMADLQGALSGTICDGAPMIPCSARTGAGLADLHAVLARWVTAPASGAAPPGAFLPVDRAFSVAGRGTVVTGTLIGGPLQQDQTLTLLPDDMPVKLRGLQSRGEAQESVAPGARCAVNLRGVSVDQVPRGSVLSAPGTVAASVCLDVAITVLPGASASLRHMEELRVIIGTTSVVAQLRLFGPGRLLPGQEGLGQLRLRTPVAAFAGQAAVLRRLSPAQTVGGIRVLDPLAEPAGAGDSARAALLAAVVGGRPASIAVALAQATGGCADLDRLARIARASQAALVAELQDGFTQIDPQTLAPNAQVQEARAALLARLSRYHADHPLRLLAPRSIAAQRGLAPALQAYVEKVLTEEGVLRAGPAGLGLASHDPFGALEGRDRDRAAEIEEQFHAGGLAPPAVAEIAVTDRDGELIELLCHAGRLVRLHNVALDQWLIFQAGALAEAAQRLHAHFAPNASFTTSEARQALSTTRRVIVPVLEHFDACGITRRTGDLRTVALPKPVSPLDGPV